MIEKIIEATKNGTLLWKIKRKIYETERKKQKILFVKNRDVKSVAYQCKDYAKLYRQYKAQIQEGVSTTAERVHSDKVWVCWLQGYEKAPALVKACINSIHGVMPEKDIVILTNENYKQYVDFPEYIEEKFQKGQIGMAHFSDLLRISLLAQWGGMWIDATALCTDKKFFEYVSKQPLFVFKQLNLSNQDDPPIIASNWYISCETNNPIILLTRNLLYSYWKDHDFAENYFIFHLFFAMACRRYKEEWNSVPTFNNNSPHVLMFELSSDYTNERWKQLMKMSGIHKLQRYEDYSDLKNSNYCHILNEYLNN